MISFIKIYYTIIGDISLFFAGNSEVFLSIVVVKCLDVSKFCSDADYLHTKLQRSHPTYFALVIEPPNRLTLILAANRR